MQSCKSRDNTCYCGFTESWEGFIIFYKASQPALPGLFLKWLIRYFLILQSCCIERCTCRQCRLGGPARTDRGKLSCRYLRGPRHCIWWDQHLRLLNKHALTTNIYQHLATIEPKNNYRQPKESDHPWLQGELIRRHHWHGLAQTCQSTWHVSTTKLKSNQF